jgi:hypothetical protein
MSANPEGVESAPEESLFHAQAHGLSSWLMERGHYIPDCAFAAIRSSSMTLGKVSLETLCMNTIGFLSASLEGHS